MKSSVAIPRTGLLAVLLVSSFLAISDTFANSVIAGGWVPEKRSLIITPVRDEILSRAGESVEVAVIEIDNNLPEYILVLDFPDGFGSGNQVSEVRLDGLDGTLGKGLSVPAATAMETGPVPGRFIWRPGIQETATVRYRVRVMVTYKAPIAEPPQMLVSMPFSY